MCTRSNTYFLGPVRVHNPNDISITSAVFCRDHDGDIPTDRPTDHATPSVTVVVSTYEVLQCAA